MRWQNESSQSAKCCRFFSEIFRLTRFIMRVRSPWASSSGVGGRGRFGGPPCWLELVAVLSLGKRPPGLCENLRLVRNDISFHQSSTQDLNEIRIFLGLRGIPAPLQPLNLTYSGFGGSLASKVPSFLVRSFASSGSLSESDVSIGSSGFTGWLLLLLLLGVVCLTPAEAVADCERLLRGGASGCGCDCWGEIPNSFNCAASMSKS